MVWGDNTDFKLGRAVARDAVPQAAVPVQTPTSRACPR